MAMLLITIINFILDYFIGQQLKNMWVYKEETIEPKSNTSSQENLREELEQLATECIIEEDFLNSAASFGINPESVFLSEDLPLQETLFDDEYFSPFEKERYEIPRPKIEETKRNIHIKWQKGSEIGHGSFGSVYIGLNLDNGQFIAVKQVYLENANKVEVKALQQEISVLQTLQHPNIVQYLGSSVEGTHLNIFLEYVAGGSIASVISKFGCFNENLTRVYTRQILNGLHYLHSRQIIHRDIKGANILVDKMGIIKLSDFGASKKLEEIVTSGCKSLQGTVYWMAPEVIKQSSYGRQADIWSLGCTVLEMVTGKPPWMDDYKTQITALYKIAMSTKGPTIPDALSRNAKDFLSLCFLRNPKERPNAQRLLNHPWISSLIPFTTDDSSPTFFGGLSDQFIMDSPNIELALPESCDSFDINEIPIEEREDLIVPYIPPSQPSQRFNQQYQNDVFMIKQKPNQRRKTSFEQVQPKGSRQ